MLALMVLAGCGTAGATAHPGVSGPAAGRISSAATTPTFTPRADAILAGCPSPRAEGAVTPLTVMRASPDDVTTGASGDIWVASRTAGVVTELSAAGATIATFPDSAGPEGLAVLPDARVAVANQVTNAIVVIDPATRRVTTLALYPNPTSNAGIDGITWDPAGGRILVPDSPTGRLVSVTEQGVTSATMASGLGRPVGAATIGATIYVAAESTPGLVAVTAGREVAIGSFTDLDEVVAWRGLLYVLDAAAGAVDAVDPASGAERPLLTRIAAGQGLAVDPTSGTLIVADSTTNRILRVASCG